MYVIKYSEDARIILKKLDRHIQIRIISTIERIQIRPFAYVKKLVGNPYFRLRVGDYRVIMDIKENELLIFVIEIGHRSRIYK